MLQLVIQEDRIHTEAKDQAKKNLWLHSFCFCESVVLVESEPRDQRDEGKEIKSPGQRQQEDKRDSDYGNEYSGGEVTQ